MKEKKGIVYIIMKAILKPIYVFLYRPKLVNPEMIPENEGVIVVGNHRHIYDPLNICISTKRQVHYLAKEFLFKYPVVGPLFKGVGCIKVYPHTSNQNAYKEAISALKKGRIIGIFPEGKVRTEEVLLEPFKTGAVRMALETGCRIVPCAITGEYIHYHNDLQVVYGKPFSVQGMSVEEANAFLYEKIKELYVENNGNTKVIYAVKEAK